MDHTELEKIRQDMSIDFTRVDKEDLNVWAGYGKELINIHISSTGLAADMRNVVTTGNLKDYTYDLFAKAYDVGNNGDLKWEVGVSYRLREIPYGIYEMYAEGKEIVLFRVRLVNSLLGLTKRICIEDKDGKEIKPSDATDKVHGTLAVRPVSSKGKSKK
ncbi:hypothetical protein QFC24_006877 [Naganishia onofrii]|uniref:Uncharacterized protein n=1 Tax=Naganishia onofrii TaxID=1851511 RepID=A0ACC2WXB1_9TREE|nr:hypothetical protein QFC24_006877 [Naganishia onofrii]